MAGILRRDELGVKRKGLQDIVVGLRCGKVARKMAGRKCVVRGLVRKWRKSMANVEFSFGGGRPGMPNLGALKSRFLRIVIVVAVFILLLASTTSIPTGHVGVLTLFGK